MRISCGIALITAGLGLGSCSQIGLGGGDSPTGPTDPPAPGSSISYTAVGASDAIGVGSSVVCVPFTDCPNGKGYVYVVTSRLRALDHAVTLLNLGLPTAVISPRLQSLGRQYGRDDLFANFISDEMLFVQRDATVVTIFAGANDVNVINAAVTAGAGGTTPTIYMDQQVALFRDDFATLLGGIRARAPSAHLVVLNLPNIGALPFLATAPLAQRQAAQRISTGITTTVINPLTSQGVRVVDLMCEPRIYQPAQLSSDGFHPNDAGYTILADAIVRAVTSASFAPPATACTQMSTVPL